jgi:hypothetical protein
MSSGRTVLSSQTHHFIFMEGVVETTQIKSAKREIRRNRFTTEEDNRIRSAVAEYGPGHWDLVARAVGPTRNARQVRERWGTYLDPEGVRPATAADDHLLLELLEIHNGRRAEIGPRIGRSSTWVRNRCRALLSGGKSRKESLNPQQLSSTDHPEDFIGSFPSDDDNLFDDDEMP